MVSHYSFRFQFRFLFLLKCSSLGSNINESRPFFKNICRTIVSGNSDKRRYPGVSCSCKFAHSLHLTGFNFALLRTTARQSNTTDTTVSSLICKKCKLEEPFQDSRLMVVQVEMMGQVTFHMSETRMQSIQHATT